MSHFQRPKNRRIWLVNHALIEFSVPGKTRRSLNSWAITRLHFRMTEDYEDIPAHVGMIKQGRRSHKTTGIRGRISFKNSDNELTDGVFSASFWRLACPKGSWEKMSRHNAIIPTLRNQTSQCPKKNYINLVFWWEKQVVRCAYHVSLSVSLITQPLNREQCVQKERDKV